MRYFRKYLPNQQVDEVDEVYRRLAVAHDRISDLESKVLKRQHASRWIEPVLLNGVAQVTGTLDTFAYRLWTGGGIQFKGHLDLSLAISPVHAFTIAKGDNGAVIPSDMIRSTVITDAAGTVFMAAMVKVEAATGFVTFTWPAS